jgi:hypothetical protein
MTYYGFYSSESANLHGYHIYKTPDGREVSVTAIYQDPNGEDYKFDDTVKVGMVTDYVRTINPHSAINKTFDDLKKYL